MTRADELVDRNLLQELAFRYAAAVDACDRDAFLAVFDPEGSLSTYAPGAAEPFACQRGHAELGLVPGEMRKRFHATQHMMTNHLVALDGVAATGTVYCTGAPLEPRSPRRDRSDRGDPLRGHVPPPRRGLAHPRPAHPVPVERDVST